MKKQLFILSFALLSLSSAMATNLVVKPLSGADYRRELATIGKVVYHGDSLYLYDSFGTLLYAEALAKVQRVVYSEGGEPTTGMAETDDAGGAVRVFPNPTASVLIMEVRSPGRTQEQSDKTARLYNQQGQLLKTTTLTTTRTTLDVSDLPAGTYLLLCGSGAFKVIVQ
ncbi:MAG: T9SS type A sorting domain-containing protein [Paludibacteraceae bacterium]|nr:T9SS type A sorting domain-containing protein [Paludibacteraceae bacterium]